MKMKLNEDLNEASKNEVDQEMRNVIEQMRTLASENARLIAELERLRIVRSKL